MRIKTQTGHMCEYRIQTRREPWWERTGREFRWVRDLSSGGCARFSIASAALCDGILAKLRVAQRLLRSRWHKSSPTPISHEEKQILETPYLSDMFNARLCSPARGCRVERTDQGRNTPFLIGHHGHLGNNTQRCCADDHRRNQQERRGDGTPARAGHR
jgi:hypothetical protein